MKKKILSLFMVLTITIFNFIPVMSVNAGVTDLRKTEKIYHTRVQGSATISGYENYAKTYDSGETYLDGDTTDSLVASKISEFKSDMTSFANRYGASAIISEEIKNSYVDAHQEVRKVTAENKDTLCDGVTDGAGSTVEDGVVCDIGNNVIVTVLDKYQTYELTLNQTINEIKNVNINLTAPILGDKVTLKIPTNTICVGDPDDLESSSPGSCLVPDKKPTATSSDNITIDSTAWIMGTYPEYGDGYDNYFSGTFEENKYYYAMISISAKDGYVLNSDLNIKVNGQSPAEVFTVYNHDNTFFIAKIKAVEETFEYKILDGANQTYKTDSSSDLVVRANGELSKLTGIKVDGTLTSEENYSLESGSTILTLKSSYLKTLSAGTHTLTFVYNDGETDTTFTISNPTTETTTDTNTTNNPQTGDSISLFILLGTLSLIGLSGSLIYLKRRKENV